MSAQNKGIEKVLKRLPNKSRFRFFLLFVFISFTFWISTKLSKEYQVKQSFSIIWKEVPKGVVLSENPEQIDLTLNASGVEILWYRLFKRTLDLSLEGIDFSTPDKVLNFEDRYFVIQQQLLNGSKLLQISPSIYPIQYSLMDSKWIPIQAQTNIQLRPGYLGEETIKTIPDSVLVRGPQAVLDTLSKIETLEYKASDVHQIIDEEIELKTLKGLQYDKNDTRLYWSVIQYSEKSLKISIEVAHLPIGVKVKLFPPEVTIKATLPLSLLNSVNASDFSLAVDYDAILSEQPSVLEVKLLKQPNSVKKTIWEPKTVNYLIRK
jgi:hypothetical protein